MSNEVEIRITSKNLAAPGFRKAKQDAEGAGRDIGKSWSGVGDEVDKVSKRVRELTEEFDKTGDAKVYKELADNKRALAGLKQVQKELEETKKDAQDAGEETGGGFKDGLLSKLKGGEGGGGGFLSAAMGSLKGGVVTAVAAIGAAAGAALIAGFKGVADRKSAAVKLTAQLADPKAARKAGEAAASVYAEGFGESIGDVGDAARRALQAGIAKSPEDLRKVTRAAMVLAETFDVDVRESMAAAQALIANGLAKDGPRAFDLISKAMTNTGDLSDDMMDTITEYSTQFRELGISAPKALGMISQMTKAGARNTDLAADALKEFAIRSKEEKDETTAAFKAIGLNAKEMYSTFSAGGPKADAAFADVIKRLNGIKDPAKQAALITSFFGTQSEDLQDALLAIDPTTAVKAFGDVGGAAQKMGDTLAEDPAKKVEKMKRAVMGGLTDFAGGVIGAFEDVGKNKDVKEFAKSLSKDILPALKSVGRYVSGQLVPFLGEVLGGALKSGRKAFKGLQDAVKDNAPELKQLFRWMDKIADFVKDKLGPVIGPVLVGNITLAVHAIGVIIRVIGTAIRAFNRMKSAASSAASGVRSRFNSLMSFIRGLPGRVSSAVSGMFSGIPRAARAAVNSARSILNGILSYARSIPGRVRSTITSGLGGLISKLPGFAHGGIVGAATGGARSGLIMAGEYGRELIRVPAGSQVIPHGQTERMMQGGGNGGAATLEIGSDGTRVGDLLVELLRVAIKKRGGNVQVILAGRPL